MKVNAWQLTEKENFLWMGMIGYMEKSWIFWKYFKLETETYAWCGSGFHGKQVVVRKLIPYDSNAIKHQ